MPRSSRHKPSKHTSRDDKGYSDSERDSSFKERKVTEEISSIVSKESSADKRKLNAKDAYGTGNGEYLEEYGSSKRRKERVLDGGESERWNGGEEESREGSRNSKTSSESKSKRKEESEGKHRESSRKERESVGERERKGKSYGLVDDEDEHHPKQLKEITDANAVDSEPENKLESRIKRRRDGSRDGDKHLDNVGDSIKRRLSSRDDISKNGEHHERYGDKHQRDDRSTKDRTSSRSAEKHLRYDDDDTKETRLKKSKPLDHDRERETDREYDMDSSSNHVSDRYQDHEHDRERSRNCNSARDHDRDYDQDWDRERDKEQEQGLAKERNRDRERETDNDRERGFDHDGWSSRYKGNHGRKRSPDEHNDSKSRVFKVHYSDMEKKPLSGGRIKSEADRGRPKSHQLTVDSANSRKRISPNSNSNVGTDEYRYLRSEESNYRDPMIEQRSSKHTLMKKSNKMDDGHPGVLSFERSSNSKASPMGLGERSPSSTCIDRRYTNRSGVRRSLDVEDTGRRSNACMDARDVIATGNRIHHDLPLDKPSGDDSQADPSVLNRTSQSSAVENDGRFNSSTRYKRSGDPNFARGQGNSWRGVPSWPSPVPNGFMPFQHGPPHGGFQAMMPQFPSPLFGVRPSMEINHAGIPYHIPDTDRFSCHLRPLRWQNMMDGSSISHLHGWDGNNGVFRDESHMYGAPDWDQSRHPMNRRGWEPSEMWKGQNGNVDKDLPSSQKEDYSMQGMEDVVSTGRAGSKSQDEHKIVGAHVKDVESRPVVASAIEKSKSRSETDYKILNPCKRLSYNDFTRCSRIYLSKLDISRDLTHPELYSQCAHLLDLEDAITEDIIMPVNMEDGKRAKLISSPALHYPSLFPAVKGTVFQRAMDLYKKQCIEPRGLAIANADVYHILNHNEGKIDEQLTSSDVEMTDAVVSTCDQQKEETLEMPALKKEIKELVPASDLEVPGHILTPSPVNLEAHHNHKDENQEESSADEDCFSAAIDSSKGDSILPTCDDDHRGKGGMIVGGDGVNGPICHSDALKAELNECESVIVSRIHHSPG